MTEGFDVGLEMSGVVEAINDMLNQHEPRRQGGPFGHHQPGHGQPEPASDHIQGPISSRASMAARCTTPGTRWPRCCAPAWTSAR
jgi:hypothetical protein